MIDGVEGRKFIITLNGELRIGSFCEHNEYFHESLIPFGDNTCYGGGMIYIFLDKKLALMKGRSVDFGYPQFDKVKYVGQLPKSWKFQYQPEGPCDPDNIDTSSWKFWYEN